MLSALRILNLIIWGLLLLYMLPGARAAVTGKGVRSSDPMRLSIATVCVVIILGNVRWLVMPDNASLMLALSILTALVGIYKIILARTYGRGPKL